MAAPKYLEDISGQLTEVAAATSGPATEEVVSTGTDGLIAASLMPVGAGPDLVNLPTFETIANGEFVNIFDDAGTAKVRKADATDAAKKADGFVLIGATAPAAVDVHLEGRNTAQSGMTIGAVQYLSTTAGGVTETAPTTANNIVQILGKAISATLMTTENLSGITVKKA